jgi:predicted negative regulator of RcsB-dependent stress response
MAAHLDLEEQEQLAELKHFWKTWGNLISWLLIAVLGSYAAWNGWQYWERNQSTKASALYDEVEKAVLAQDVARVERSMADMKERFASTPYAHQAGLLAARTLVAKDKPDQARALLAWVADKAPQPAWRDLARVRLAALQWESQSVDEALKTLQAEFGSETAPLAADLRGDLLLSKGQTAEAVAAYRQAFKGLQESHDYRRVVQAKLAVLGIDVATNPAAEVRP